MSAAGTDQLAELRRVFAYEHCEKMGNYWYISVQHVVDRLNAVLGFDWSFDVEHVEHHPSQQERHDGGDAIEGYEAVVHGHLLAFYRDENGERQTLKRPGADSGFNVSAGAAIKGATSGALVKAAWTLGVGHELYGKKYGKARRDDLDKITDRLPDHLKEANAVGDEDTQRRKRANGHSNLNQKLKAEALLWRERHSVDAHGKDLAETFRENLGYSGSEELSASEKVALLTEAIERRWGARQDHAPSNHAQSRA